MKKLLGAVTGLTLVFATVVPADAADKNSAPVKTVSGASSELQNMSDIDVAADGTTFAASVYWDSLFTYAPTAGANAVPGRKIYGSKALLNSVSVVSLDPQGRPWAVLNATDNHSVGGFVKNANGNVSPFRTIGGSNTGISNASGQVTGIAFGPNGDVFVADATSDSIRVFDAQAGGNVAPKRVIAGANTQLAGATDIATDPVGNLYVLIPTEAMVLVFKAGASGNVFPTRAVFGSNSGLVAPYDIDVDSGRNLYVSDASEDSVSVFLPSANGDVAPYTRLKGASTQIGNINGLSVGPDRRVHVLESSGKINIYRPLVPFTKAGIVRALKVGGTKAAAKRTVSWAAPVVKLNAGTITAYRVIVKKGTKVLVNKLVPASSRSLALAKSKLRTGSLKVTVVAVNKQGNGPAKTVAFTVS